jgi:hypothetical protein
MAIWDGDGGVAYNGYAFNKSSKTKLHLQFLPDSSGRATAETVHTLTVKAVIAATPGVGGPAEQEAELLSIRAALEQPGAPLTVTGLGFGDIALNRADGSGSKDLRWGPRPKVLSFVHHGGEIAATVEWVCEFSTLGCSGAPSSGVVMDASHEIVFATDTSGYTTRTYNGTIRIPVTWDSVADPVPPDIIESYWTRSCPTTLPRFKRTTSRTVSRDGSTLNFTVIDTEQAGNPLPEGCTDARASHILESTSAYVGCAWTGTIEAEYEMAVGRARSDAWKYFLDLFSDRIQIEQQQRLATPIPTRLVLSEPELYGKRSAAFTLQYRLVYGKPGTIRAFPFYGLWRPTPGGDWFRWDAANQDNAKNPRGNAGLGASTADYIITNLCLGSSQGRGGGSPGDVQVAFGSPPDTPWDQFRKLIGLPDQPAPEGTWLEYWCIPEVETHDRMRVHMPLPTGPDPGKSGSSMHTPGFTPPSPGAFPQTAPPFNFASQDSPGPVVQYGGSPGYYVWLRGHAFRHTYEIPRPQLVTVNGATPVDANDPKLGCFFRAGLIGWTVAPLYAAEWALRWFVPRNTGDQPTPIPLAPHPFQGADIPIR